MRVTIGKHTYDTQHSLLKALVDKIKRKRVKSSMDIAALEELDILKTRMFVNAATGCGHISSAEVFMLMLLAEREAGTVDLSKDETHTTNGDVK